MRFFKKKGQKKKKKKKQEKTIKFDIIFDVEKIKNKFQASGLKVQDEFFKLFKDFFKEYFNIKYHFTYEEFNDEIRKNRKLDKHLKSDTISLSTKLSNIEYGSRKLSRNELKFMIADFESIVVKLLEMKKEKKPKLSPKKIFAPFLKVKEKIANTYTKHKSKVSKVMTQTKEELRRRNLEHLNDLIAQTQEALRNNDSKKARQAYSEMRKIFDKLPVEDRRAKYKRIMDLYEKIVEL